MVMARLSPAHAVPDRDTAAARLFRVLGDPTRLAIVRLLLERERTVSELVAAVGAPRSRISNHLACLRWCRFVETERQGRRVIYRLTDRHIPELLAQAEVVAADRIDHLVACRRIGPDWI
jgi:ArsR family transcriptional regulator, cadmium/lead-responsive transcriptional repressor